jgi:general secretion pathway protein D
MAVLAAAVLTGPVAPLHGQDKSVQELRPLNSDPINLLMTNQTPRTLYETVAKIAGVDVLWDPEARAQSETARFNVKLSNATLREALDKVAALTKTSWKTVSATTIAVALR